MPGIEGVYIGMWHPLTSPDQILALLATGFLLGSFPLSRLLPAFGALLAGLLGGLALGDPATSPAPWLHAYGASVAAAAALAPGRSLAMAVVAANAGGLLLGWASVPDPGPAEDRLFTMAGAFAGILLLVLYLAGALELLRERVAHPARAVAVRVAAAWIAAIAVLMLALSLAPQTG